jgi:predicted nucleic acid-binding protein
VPLALEEFLDYVFKASNLVPSVLRRRPSLRDPDDERILEVAVDCHAVIVTFNKRDFAWAERFGIQVQTPGEFMRVLEKANER